MRPLGRLSIRPNRRSHDTTQLLARNANIQQRTAEFVPGNRAEALDFYGTMSRLRIAMATAWVRLAAPSFRAAVARCSSTVRCPM